ncbi:MAG: Sporulation domain protein [Myxococcales bacterium]|nr:Sporulation domain protein [Myxococcales bacterium]
MRDLDRWKDKVEISLDGRQIFFLFFGSAIAACLIFVTGVLIGKRIEARALALQPAPIEDPLAALDQLGDADEADEGLTFHKALAPVKAAAAAKNAAAPSASAAVADDKSDDKPIEKEKSDKAEKADKAEKEKAEKIDKSEAKPLPLPPAPSPARALAPLPAARPQVVQATPPPKKADASAAAAKKPDATSTHFTLQLSAFPDKSDAEEFMRKIQSAGYKPFLVASEIPGKGIFFRVRVGDYASRQSAVDAKAEFERKQRIIAYVAKL